MKYKIAVGTRDDKNITEHFGQCPRFLIIEVDQESDETKTLEVRSTAYNVQCGEHQDEKIKDKINALKDCRIVLAKQIGGQSEKLLNHNGLIALQYDGLIEDALKRIIRIYKGRHFTGKE